MFEEMVASTILSHEKLPPKLHEMTSTERWALRVYKKHPQQQTAEENRSQWTWKQWRRHTFVNYESQLRALLADRARGIKAVINFEKSVLSTMDLYALSRSLRRDWIPSPPTNNIFFTGDWHTDIYERVLTSLGYTLTQSISDDSGCLDLSNLRQPWDLYEP